MGENGHLACGRCWEQYPPETDHLCLDRQPSIAGGSAILSDDYRTEQTNLLADPIIADMAAGMNPPGWSGTPWSEIMHPGGTPRHEFMLAANAEYRARGGTQSFSIGGVAHALITILTSGEKTR